MTQSANTPPTRPPLRPGDQVTVASRDEILASLETDGALNGMPLMPQMLDLCGSTQTVSHRADKSCDTINGSGGLRLRNTVHLEGMRCDGKAYGGCQAGCLLFWNENWLKRDPNERLPTADVAGAERRVMQQTRQPKADDNESTRYRCQATELVRASEPLAWWDLRQYWRDWHSNGVSASRILRSAGFWLFRQSLKIGAYSAQVRAYNALQGVLGGKPFPFKSGTQTRTPSEDLGLCNGDYVRVKSHEAIVATLDKRNRNRGLSFDAEMVKFCGGVFRVQLRVDKIINEKSGEMMQFGTPGIILENVYCTSQVSAKRLFCPRAIHHYWREIWLERLDGPG